MISFLGNRLVRYWQNSDKVQAYRIGPIWTVQEGEGECFLWAHELIHI